jgi:hypothetical protein
MKIKRINMKRKIIFSVLMLALTGIIALQSCKKEAGTKVSVFHAFTEPAIVSPANEATIEVSGTTVSLTWESTNADGNAVKADVYFGTDPEPPLYSEGLTTLTLSVPVVKGQTYYWYVVMTDVHGITTPGPVWSFTVFEPIGIFVGDFLCDEPAEDYSYDVSFYKVSDNLLATDNYWNSGWTAEFTMNFTANTYNMPLTVWGTYSSQESGTIDPATGTMVGNYTIWHNTTAIETGVHTYTKY